MKILVALDETPESVRAAHEAARLFPDGEFLVVNVSQRIVPWMVAPDFGAVYPMNYADLPAEGLPTDEIQTRAEAAGLDHAAVVAAEGDPATAICAAADEHDVDVVVVGSHDKGMLRRIFEPSVAHAVVQGTFRPVLVVSGEPPEPAKE